MTLLIDLFLKTNNYKKESYDFKDLFLSHPNYPSLYAITDTLNLLGIENIAAQVPKEQLLQLPNSFLAYYANEIVLVDQSNGFITIQKEKEQKKKISTDDFLNDWNGIVIAIEPSEVVNKQNTSFFNNKYFLIGVILISILLFQFQNFNILFVLNFGLILLGLFVSILIIDEKLNTSDGVVSKMCSFSEKTSCDSVIKSDDAKLTKWLDFSDLPILFFATSVVSILISQNSIGTINLLAVLSLPVIGYSIWLQKVKLEKWCVLCLGISSLLVFQSVLFFIYSEDFNFNYFSLIQGIVLVFPIWFFIKPVLFGKIKVEQENLGLIKFKRNFSIFNSLQKEIIDEYKLQMFPKIELGNPSAKVNLTLILSPSCGHCHTAFKEGLYLIANYSQKVNVSVFFNLNPDNGDNPYFSIAENLLQINKDYPNKIEEAISDWHIRKMDVDQWKLKWEQKDIEYTTEENLRAQYEWCTANEFNYTPVKLINNKLFPKEYELNELKYFLSELQENEEPVMV